MKITSARYTANGNEIEAVIDGVTMIVPNDPENIHAQALVEWSGTIEPYEPPAPSEDPSDYDLLPWQFKALIDFLELDGPIKSAIEQIEDPFTRSAAMSKYQNASFYSFDDPLLQSVASMVEIDEAAMRENWMKAKDL